MKLLGFVVGLLLSVPALAQLGMAEPEPLIAPSEIAGLHRIMESTKEQEKAVDQLRAGAMAQLSQAEERQRKVSEWWRSLPEEDRTPERRSEFIERLQELEPDTAKLRERFFADARATLTPAQEERWPAYERFLRRDRLMGDRLLRFKPFDRTNLLGVIQMVELTEAERAAAAPLLDRYERELDSKLREYEVTAAEVDLAIKKIGPASDEAQMERIREAGKPLGDASKAISMFNYQYVRRISGVLTPEHATAFSKAYERVCLREAYGFESQDVMIRTAPDLPGIAPEKRERLHKNAAEHAPKWDEFSRRIAAMERRSKPAQPEDEAIDTTDWDKVRLERWQTMATYAKVVQTTLSEDEWKRLWEEVNRRESEWKAKLAR
ncbi:MAG TPA: hypothetical protein VD997_14285 [Phycisphaerales bacterium]|nr:hypothetical protein [Phycisphaerales bacterium]